MKERLNKFKPYLGMLKHLEWSLEYGPGWDALVLNTLKRLKKVCPKIQITTLKEKFGGLRIYPFDANDKAFDIIEDAEEESYKICENCGEAGELYGGGWVRTLCAKCAKKFNYDKPLTKGT